MFLLALAAELLKTIGWQGAKAEEITLLGFTALAQAVRRRSAQSFNGPTLKIIADVDLSLEG